VKPTTCDVCGAAGVPLFPAVDTEGEKLLICEDCAQDCEEDE